MILLSDGADTSQERGFSSKICGKALPPPTWGLPAYPSLIYDNYFLILHLCGGILFEFHNNAAADMKCFQAGSGLPEAAFIKISFCPYFMFIAAIFN